MYRLYIETTKGKSHTALYNQYCTAKYAMQYCVNGFHSRNRVSIKNMHIEVFCVVHGWQKVHVGTSKCSVCVEEREIQKIPLLGRFAFPK